MSLFIEQPTLQRERPEFVKFASVPISLSNDETRWVQEITSEVYKSFPFLQGSDIRVQIIRSDKETGTATGRVVISAAAQRQDMAAPQTPPLFLPFVVRGFEMSPLDVATDGERYFPASQKRIERHLFQPSVASVGPDQSAISPVTSFAGELIPPGQSFRGGMNQGMSQVKLGSVLDDALVCSSPDTLGAMREHLSKDLASLDALRSTVPYSLMKIANWVPSKESIDTLPFPTVVMMEKKAGGQVRVTLANRNAFVKIAQDIPEEQAMQQLPPDGQQDMQQQMGQQGFGMMQIEQPVIVPQLPKQDPTQPIRATGTYICFQEDGSQVTGWATRNVMSFDGQPTQMVLFSNGSAFAFQPEIAGVPVGTGHLPPSSRNASGMGAFCFRADGDIYVYGPVQVMSSGQMPDGSLVYTCADMMSGAQIILQPMPELIRPAPMGEGMYGIPQMFEFLPMNQQTPLLPPGRILKMASASLARMSSISLTSPYYGAFNVTGSPTDELGHTETTSLTKSAAAFLLASCGVPSKAIPHFLKQAEEGKGKSVDIPNVRPISSYAKVKGLADKNKEKSLKKPPKWTVKEAAVLASSLRGGLGQRAQITPALFKTAAPMPDQDTVDSVLSLNLINPRTVSTFIRQKPKLEEALSHLCGLLLFARIGAPGVPELALERCIENMEDVVDSLDMMSYRV